MGLIDELTGSWGRALLVGAGLSLGYTGLVLGYSFLPSSPVTITGPFPRVVGWYSLLAFGAVGVPVVLRLRFGLRTPLALLAGILLFWHVVVGTPLLDGSRADAPAFTFVFFWAPFYLVAYALLAGAEHALRARSNDSGDGP